MAGIEKRFAVLYILTKGKKAMKILKELKEKLAAGEY